MTDEKQSRKRKRKEAELQEAMASAESAVLELEQKKIDLANARDSRAIAEANPDLTGRFGFNSDVNDQTVEILRVRLQSFAHRNPGKPISISITSPGGGVFDGFHLFATIRDLSSQGHHITTVASGIAASMGAVLLQAGDHRVIGAESMLMLHEVSSFAIGKAGEIRRESEFLDRVTNQMCAIFARRSTLTHDEIYERIQDKDWWIWPQEAVEIGFADEVRQA